MPTLCITGSNRGLGLEFVRQYLDSPDHWRILACCRDPDKAKALRALQGDIKILPLDVSRPDSIQSLGAKIDEPIDVLINNAGVFAEDDDAGAGDMQVYATRWQHDFQINTIAPLLTARVLLPNISAGEQKKIIAITSKMGSIGDNSGGGYTIYRSTKTALNMVYKNLALELQPQGISVNVFHPGWVRTDMGGASARLSPPESVTGLRNVIEKLNMKKTGKFYEYTGAELPW